MKLRSYLLLLVVFLLIPPIAFSVFVIINQHDQEILILERGMRDTARALSAALDREFLISIQSLKVLAASDTLQNGNLSRFYREMKETLVERPRGWRNINLVDRSGQQLINLRERFGAKLPLATDPAFVNRVVQRSEPAISNLVRGPVTGAMGFVVAVPVIAGGAVKYTLNAVMYPDVFDNLLAEQKLPPAWIAAVIDASSTIVARTHGIDEFLGAPSSSMLAAESRAQEEGWFQGLTRENVAVYTAFSRSRLSGWTVAIGAPVREVHASARRSLRITAAAGGALLLLGLAVASIFARRITGSVNALSTMAKAVGAGVIPAAEASPVLELDRVGRELAAAALARRGAENAVRRERDFSEAALNSLPGIFYVIDDTGRFLRWNRNFELVTGYASTDIAGMNLLDFFTGPDKLLMANRFRIVLEEGSAGAETEFLTKEGVTKPYYFTGLRTSLEGKRYVIGVGIEITERKRVEQALKDAHHALEEKVRQRTRELTEANSRLKDLDRLKTEFLANMSHELRTPLNGIIGFSQMLVDERPGVLNPEQRDYLNDILGCAEHLLQLINDLLDLSKIEAEKMELTLEPFSAQHIIREVCSAMTPAATKQAVRIRTEVSPDVEFVRLDPLRFKQIIYNLVSNAVKFSKRGKEVLVRLEPAFQRHFRITVVDSGIGIRSDDLGRLFGKFEQLQSGLARGHEGSGLGLALTKKLVELHNGSIEAQSEFGWGSTFTVVLPVDASK